MHLSGDHGKGPNGSDSRELPAVNRGRVCMFSNPLSVGQQGPKCSLAYRVPQPLRVSCGCQQATSPLACRSAGEPRDEMAVEPRPELCTPPLPPASPSFRRVILIAVLLPGFAPLLSGGGAELRGEWLEGLDAILPKLINQALSVNENVIKEINCRNTCTNKKKPSYVFARAGDPRLKPLSRRRLVIIHFYCSVKTTAWLSFRCGRESRACSLPRPPARPLAPPPHALPAFKLDVELHGREGLWGHFFVSRGDSRGRGEVSIQKAKYKHPPRTLPWPIPPRILKPALECSCRFNSKHSNHSFSVQRSREEDFWDFPYVPWRGRGVYITGFSRFRKNERNRCNKGGYRAKGGGWGNEEQAWFGKRQAGQEGFRSL